MLGHSIHLTDMLRVYGEAIYLLQNDLEGNWEFQFGAEVAPVDPTRLWGSPFAAANVYLLESENFGGNLTLQAGWLWRGRNVHAAGRFVLFERPFQQFRPSERDRAADRVRPVGDFFLITHRGRTGIGP